MGAGASVNAETFATIKDHYEAKKAEGLTDEQLFDAMKTHLESIAPAAAPTDAPAAEEPVAEAPVAEAPAAEAAPADTPAE